MQQIRRLAAWLAQVEIYPVALLILAGMLDSAWLPVAVLGAALFWPVRRLAYGRWSARTPLDWPLLLLLLMLPVTLWASAIPEKTLPQVWRLLAGAALFYALVNWVNSLARLRLALNLAQAAGISLALAAPVVVQWNALKLAFIPASLYQRFRVLVADPANPNVMAGSLVLLVPLGVALLLAEPFAGRSQANWERLLSAVLVLLGGLVLFLTQSRGAWLALLVSLAVLALLRWRRSWLLWVGGGVAVGLLVIAWEPARLAENLVSSLTLGSSAAGIEGRLEVWSRALYMLQDFPFTGIGMGTFTEVADRLYPFFLYAPGTVEHAHNLYLQVGVDLGLPGLVAWLALALGALLSAFLAWRCSTNCQFVSSTNGQYVPWLAGAGAGLLSVQVGLLVHGLSDAVVWGMVRPAPLVWLMWGLAVAAFNLAVKREADLAPQ